MLLGSYQSVWTRQQWGTYLEMLRVVKFVIDTKTFCLKIRPEKKIKNWSLHVFGDSDWAGNSEKRISITGFIVYLMNVPVCWRSKAQRGVTLSSREAEYVAISEAVKEIKFINYLLREIGIEVNLPITVKTDNVGAMFMAQNALSGVSQRHIVIITSERIWKKELSTSSFSSQLRMILIFSRRTSARKFKTNT
jgi:hypothetical protein